MYILIEVLPHASGIVTNTLSHFDTWYFDQKTEVRIPDDWEGDDSEGVQHSGKPSSSMMGSVSPKLYVWTNGFLSLTSMTLISRLCLHTKTKLTVSHSKKRFNCVSISQEFKIQIQRVKYRGKGKDDLSSPKIRIRDWWMNRSRKVSFQ